MRRNLQAMGWMTVTLAAFFLGRTVQPLGPAVGQPLNPALQPLTPAGQALTPAGQVGANFYMQTAAEYRACCLQTYRLATEKLDAARKADDGSGKPMAIVMDLDETVVDNGAFQSYLLANGKGYAQADWDRYEQFRPQDVAWVPGAKAFIAAAEAKGFTMIYLSNRQEKFIDGTVAALKHLGMAEAGLKERLFLSTTTSNKEPRRMAIREKYQVKMLFGDNLRDFSEDYRANVAMPRSVDDNRKVMQARKAQVDADATHLGVDWWILPNPAYGEWEKLGTPNVLPLLHPATKLSMP